MNCALDREVTELGMNGKAKCQSDTYRDSLVGTLFGSVGIPLVEVDVPVRRNSA